MNSTQSKDSIIFFAKRHKAAMLQRQDSLIKFSMIHQTLCKQIERWLFQTRTKGSIQKKLLTVIKQRLIVCLLFEEVQVDLS